MSKTIIQKGNVHESDYIRAVLTDTAPEDIPIIVSNDGFYKNYKRLGTMPARVREFVDKVFSPSKVYTVPYRYNILKGADGSRQLSLTHPSAQIGVAKFYKEYGHIICYFCRKSENSLRAPSKVGSLYFIRGTYSEANKYKKGGIDTIDVEKAVANPASYFAYRGVDRAYKFFTSSQYLRLEKKYPVMNIADISKCFNSIYTHTLYWAIVDIDTAKNNTSARTFSNKFDRLMQSMNFNETNGICVGPEVSRLFAELILSEVDRRVVVLLEKNYNQYRDYEFYRYVDDYHIFARSTTVARSVSAAIQLALSEFNLHLNERKSITFERPFITDKSRITRDVSIALGQYFDKFIRTEKIGDLTISISLQVRRKEPLIRSLFDDVKASCFDQKVGYDTISNYAIAAIAARIVDIVDGYPLAAHHSLSDLGRTFDAIMILLESMYFFYTVNPSIPASLHIARASIVSARFVRQFAVERSVYLSEELVRWTHALMQSLSGSTRHDDLGCVPLEALNALFILTEIDGPEHLSHECIRSCCTDIDKMQYFEVVSILFCAGSKPLLGDLREKLFERGKELVKSGRGIQTDAESAHISLDLLSCPFLDRAERAKWLNVLRKTLSLSQLTNHDAGLVIDELEANPWFVSWDKVDLLNLVRKKELGRVY